MSNSKGYQVTCDEDQYQYEDRCCSKCPAGSRVHEFCTDDTPTLCSPCSEGTFMEEMTSSRECVSCTSCSEGLQVKMACSMMFDTVCVPEEGYLCAKTVDNSCVEANAHSHCDPGQYISQNGTADNDTVCSNCTVGTFSNEMLTACLPHTPCASMLQQLLTPGTESEDAQCGGLHPAVVAVIVCIILVVALILTFIKMKKYYKRRKREHARDGLCLKL